MSRLRVRSLCAVACLVGMGWAGPGEASETFDLVWNAPESCPDAAWVQAAISRLAPAAAAQSGRAVIEVHAERGAWLAELRLEGDIEGGRSLRADSCLAAARASALVVALALDPQAAARAAGELERDGQPVVARPAEDEPTAPPPSPTKALPPPLPRRATVVGHVFLGPALERGSLPGWTPGLGLGGGIGWRGLRADLGVQLALPRHVRLDEQPMYGAALTLQALEGRACAGGGGRWGTLHGCAGLRGLRLGGQGEGPLTSRRGQAVVAEAGAGLLLRVPRDTRLAAEASGMVGVPFTRPELVLLEGDHRHLLHRLPVLSVRFALSASWRF